MQPFYVKDIVEATGGQLICGNENTQIEAVSTDSRALTEGTLFVPLKGERSDGHDYTSGAKIYISERDEAPTDGKCIVKVESTLKAFGAIAKLYKSKYPLPTVSVVGSVGKTTTRDMIAAVMSQKYNTLKTDKNFNNDIGVPIMVFRLGAEHEAAVLEMGMSSLGEIEYLADIVRPDVVVMTNIGMSHIEKLGSQDNIFKAKMEAVTYLDENSTVIANADDNYLKNVHEYGSYKVIYYAIENENADVCATDIEDFGLDGVGFTVCAGGEKTKIRLYVPGVHNVYNALAAIASGMVYGIKPEDSAKGLENARFTAMRMEVSEHSGIRIINDCYNSAPSSVKAALAVLAGEKNRRRVAVLGDILEMGDFAKDAHTEIGSNAKTVADVLVCVGNNGKYIADGAKGHDMLFAFDSTEAACKEICSVVKTGDTVLLKASRGMHFEKLFEKLTEERG